MTELRFHITPGIIPTPLLEKTYFASWGRMPRPTEVILSGNEMTVRSGGKGSGTIHVLWPHEQFGLIMESTETLIESKKTYYLLKELCRGALGRLLRKLFEWQMIGYRQDPLLRERITEVSRRFSRLSVADNDDHAVEREHVLILEELDQISQANADAFADQSLAWRLRGEERLPVLFGIGMNSHPIETLYEFDLYAGFLQEAFHAILPMPTWRELEPEPGRYQWERLEQRLENPTRFGFKVILGPLLCFDTTTFPQWILPRLHEIGGFESHATRFVNAVIERFGSRAESCILASRFNSVHIPDFPPSRSIALIRMLAQQIRSRGLESPILIGINQPWGEYALSQVPEYDQLQIAESLMGCPEIDAFLIEMHFGFDEHSTFPRDLMSISSMLDQWSFLGKRVYVLLSVPSSTGDVSSDLSSILPIEYQWTEGMQQLWTESLLKTILAKRLVQGVFWSPLQDRLVHPEDKKTVEPFSAPFGGLIDSDRILKLAFKHFSLIRKSLLK